MLFVVERSKRLREAVMEEKRRNVRGSALMYPTPKSWSAPTSGSPPLLQCTSHLTSGDTHLLRMRGGRILPQQIARSRPAAFRTF